MRAGLAIIAACLLAVPLVASAQQAPIGWPEAIARLAAERTRANSCVEQARTLGISTTDPLVRLYAEAKAEVDGVIAGLAVALAERREPVSLPELERRMTAGLDGRQRFCVAIDARLPPRAPGERSLVGDALTALVAPVLEAVVKLWDMRREDDRLRRDTIRAQLEATKWPDLAAATPPGR